MFVPLTLASANVDRLTRVRLDANTVWRWVQRACEQTTASLEAELPRLAAKR